VDASTGEKKVLISDEKLAKLAPPIESIKDDRQKDQISRNHVAPYYWPPDSKHLLFNPYGQLWLYGLATGTTVQIGPSPDGVRDPKFSSDAKRLAYVRAQVPCLRRFSRGTDLRFSLWTIAALRIAARNFRPQSATNLETSSYVLFAEYPQLDRNRVGIWGWSNGGSMTLYALTHSGRFQAGASVAPVTDWRDYDSIYTERYQGLPAEDPAVYDNPITNFAGKLNGALVLAHGTEDDNVHLQNSIQMIDALIRAGKQFRFMAYPNKTHSIEGAEYQIQLFHMIEDHFERELKSR